MPKYVFNKELSNLRFPITDRNNSLKLRIFTEVRKDNSKQYETSDSALYQKLDSIQNHQDALIKYKLSPVDKAIKAHAHTL